jgi:NAD-dependent dihydropyrimidine dehydrogenase PreA subunit
MIRIDEDKCTGCGLCVPSCAEGALQIIDGKARLVSDVLCDGLGACLGECPEGALTVEERDAPAFDEAAVAVHLTRIGRPAPVHAHAAHAPAPVVAQPRPTPVAEPAHAGGCPGSRAMSFNRAPVAHAAGASTVKSTSELGQWPVQLMLMPVRAPYYQGANLLLCADCVPFAYPDFHRDLLKGNVVAIGCPKLDDAGFYVEKLGTILRDNDIQGITVAHMEVPCCFGLVRVVQEALRQAGKDVPVRDLTISVQGDVREN